MYHFCRSELRCRKRGALPEGAETLPVAKFPQYGGGQLLVLSASRQLLGIFNTDPEVIAAGQIRLAYIFFAYLFSFAQEGLSGYLRGFGVSFIPAACAVVGICGVRLTWIFTVFRQAPSFPTIMQVYPLSLGVTAAAILAVTLAVKPSRKYITALPKS